MKLSLNIAKKIWLSILILAAGYMLSVLVTVWGNVQTERKLRAVSSDLFPAAVLSESAHKVFEEQVQQYKDAVLFGEESLLRSADAKSKAVLRLLEQISELDGLPTEQLKDVREVRDELKDYSETSNTVYSQMIRSVESEDLPPKAERLQQQRIQVTDKLLYLSQIFAKQLRNQVKAVSNDNQRGFLISIGVFVIVVLLALGLVHFIVSREIVRPLDQTVTFAEAVANGDLSRRLQFQTDDEIGQLGNALNSMAGQLKGSIEELMRHREHLEDLVQERTFELERDMSRREQAEKRFKIAFHSNANLMFIASIEDGTIIEVNEAFCNVLGWQKIQVTNHTVEEIDLFVNDAVRRNIIETIRVQRSIRQKEVEFQTFDGNVITCLLAADLITMEAGEYLLFVGLDITQRKKAQAELAEANKKLLETALLAGKAEVATGVLHNVGNVLNSVGVTVYELRARNHRSQLRNFSRLAELLQKNSDNMEEFLQTEQGRKLPVLMEKLSEALETERKSTLDDLTRLNNHIEHITEIITLQQEYSKSVGLTELVMVDELIDDAVQINAASLDKQGITLDLKPSGLPPAQFDRHKILQILINLIGNAKYALLKSKSPNKVLTIAVDTIGNDRIAITVTDNGIGISPENMKRIFNHGFTTKKEGHGFGLHSCANAARQLGGELRAESEGEGHGARFVLELPYTRQVYEAVVSA